jgi:hypothetical protein
MYRNQTLQTKKKVGNFPINSDERTLSINAFQRLNAKHFTAYQGSSRICSNSKFPTAWWVWTQRTQSYVLQYANPQPDIPVRQHGQLRSAYPGTVIGFAARTGLCSRICTLMTNILFSRNLLPDIQKPCQRNRQRCTQSRTTPEIPLIKEASSQRIPWDPSIKSCFIAYNMHTVFPEPKAMSLKLFLSANCNLITVDLPSRSQTVYWGWNEETSLRISPSQHQCTR